jgi:hypothetical protein
MTTPSIRQVSSSEQASGPDQSRFGSLPMPAWQEALVDHFPQLFGKRFSQRSIEPRSFAIGKGWRGTVETLVQRLCHVVGARRVEIVRVSQGRGRLRVDTWTGDNIDSDLQMEMDYVIALAEARSLCTCEQCGREGLLHQSGSLLLTRCTEHAVGNPAPVRPGMERVHLVRKMVGGRPGPISAGRYDRTTDTFVDVDPSTLELEDPT